MTFTYPEVTTIDIFYTTADGELITPQTLEYGKGYSLVEVQAPYGYVLNSEPVYFDVMQDNSEIDGGITVIEAVSYTHLCDSPYIQGWKLEMMAEQVFDRYIENADKVMELSYAMLEKHIADQEELPDNTDAVSYTHLDVYKRQDLSFSRMLRLTEK